MDPYRCSTCGRVFVVPSLRVDHVVIHQDQPRYIGFAPEESEARHE
jgi:hypothetical protein